MRRYRDLARLGVVSVAAASAIACGKEPASVSAPEVASIDVTSAAAVTAGAPMTPAAVVRLEDASGHLVATATQQVTLAIPTGTARDYWCTTSTASPSAILM